MAPLKIEIPPGFTGGRHTGLIPVSPRQSRGLSPESTALRRLMNIALFLADPDAFCNYASLATEARGIRTTKSFRVFPYAYEEILLRRIGEWMHDVLYLQCSR